MVILLYILFVLAALVVTLVVLIQDDKGEGIGGLFGGGSGTAFGSRSGNVLTRFTGIVAAVFLVTAVILGLASRTKERGEITGPTTEQTTKQKFFEPIARETTSPQPGSDTLSPNSPSPSPSPSASPASNQ
jgi:preprotein translocase subunit SecG